MLEAELAERFVHCDERIGDELVGEERERALLRPPSELGAGFDGERVRRDVLHAELGHDPRSRAASSGLPVDAEDQVGADAAPAGERVAQRAEA
ncbi:MAG: hypothetical protein U0263_13140 [Polyangiaceae bacterium]